MHRKILSPVSSPRDMNRTPLSFPQFVRPSMNLAMARARLASPAADTLWTPNLLDRLQAPLRSYRD